MTVKRGTLRYRGFSDIMWAFKCFGLLSETDDPRLSPDAPPITWRRLLESALPQPVRPRTEAPCIVLRSCKDAGLCACLSCQAHGFADIYLIHSVMADASC